MIKTGIYGSSQLADPVRKQLLRLLLRHPDVDLRMVASAAGNTVPLEELYPVFAGETQLTLEREMRLDGLDVLFVIDEENLTPEIVERFKTDDTLKVIVLGKATELLSELPEDFVYGLPEYYRKALVRGARAAVSPRAVAMILELALLPLARKGFIESHVEARVAAPAGSDTEAAVHEASTMLSSVQGGHSVTIEAVTTTPPPFGRIDLTAVMATPLAIEEIEKMYIEAFEDHNFVYLLSSGTEIDEDLRGSNKCLLQLSKSDGVLTVKATLDALTKGCTGNAVHIMDLLFGLHERTGLSI